MKKIISLPKLLLVLVAVGLVIVAWIWFGRAPNDKESAAVDPDSSGGDITSEDISRPVARTNRPIVSPLKLIHTINTATEADLSLSSDGKLLAGGRGKDVYIWDTARAALKTKLTGHKKKVITTAFSPDGTLLASTSTDDTVILWDVDDGRIKQQFQNGGRPPAKEWRPVAFSADGKSLATHLGKGNGLRLWDIASGEAKDFPFSKGGGALHLAVRNVAFSSAGLLGGAGGVLRYFDPTSLRESKPIGFSKDLRSLAFSPDGNTLVAAGADFAVFVWQVPDGIQPVRLLIGYEEPISTVTFSPDGAFLGVATELEVRLLSKDDWNLKATLPGDTWVAFTADNRVVATGKSVVNLWDLTSLKPAPQP